MTCPTCKAEVVVERVEEDCHNCDGSGRGDFGAECDYCVYGTIETTEFICDCEDDE